MKKERDHLIRDHMRHIYFNMEDIVKRKNLNRLFLKVGLVILTTKYREEEARMVKNLSP